MLFPVGYDGEGRSQLGNERLAGQHFSFGDRDVLACPEDTRLADESPSRSRTQEVDLELDRDDVAAFRHRGTGGASGGMVGERGDDSGVNVPVLLEVALIGDKFDRAASVIDLDKSHSEMGNEVCFVENSGYTVPSWVVFVHILTCTNVRDEGVIRKLRSGGFDQGPPSRFFRISDLRGIAKLSR